MRFFAPLRSAQNDKSCYVIVNKVFISNFATKTVSLSCLFNCIGQCSLFTIGKAIPILSGPLLTQPQLAVAMLKKWNFLVKLGMVQQRIIFNSSSFLRDNEPFGWLGVENQYIFRTISYLGAFH